VGRTAVAFYTNNASFVTCAFEKVQAQWLYRSIGTNVGKKAEPTSCRKC
jgi:hypothetical protein